MEAKSRWNARFPSRAKHQPLQDQDSAHAHGRLHHLRVVMVTAVFPAVKDAVWAQSRVARESDNAALFDAIGAVARRRQFVCESFHLLLFLRKL